MSHIPNSAMPHAGPSHEPEAEASGGSALSQRAGKIAELARDNPKTAIAAGAAVVAGAIAAAAIPLVGAAKKRASAKKSGGASKSKKSS